MAANPNAATRSTSLWIRGAGVAIALGYDRAAVKTASSVRVSIVIVTFNSGEAIRRSLPALTRQLRSDDQLVMVDNASDDDTLATLRVLAPHAIVIRNSSNDGFAAACNAGVDASSGELIVLLNPDATPANGFRDAIVAPLDENCDWSAWMGLVTADGGTVINTSGGVVHFTGIAWAGNAGEPLSTEPDAPREVAFLSGACLAIPRDTWQRHDGFSPRFFMYCEDVDLSLRLRLAGGLVGIEPRARVQHDYDFDKGSKKWRLLERNRWATIIRTYPMALLFVLAPALVATELAIFLIALTQGWVTQKMLATADTVRALPRLASERHAIQQAHRIDALEFARWLTPDLDSRYLGRAGSSSWLRRALRAYWALALAVLRLVSAR